MNLFPFRIFQGFFEHSLILPVFCCLCTNLSESGYQLKIPKH